MEEAKRSNRVGHSLCASCENISLASQKRRGEARRGPGLPSYCFPLRANLDLLDHSVSHSRLTAPKCHTSPDPLSSLAAAATVMARSTSVNRLSTFCRHRRLYMLFAACLHVLLGQRFHRAPHPARVVNLASHHPHGVAHCIGPVRT